MAKKGGLNFNEKGLDLFSLNPIKANNTIAAAEPRTKEEQKNITANEPRKNHEKRQTRTTKRSKMQQQNETTKGLKDGFTRYTINIESKQKELLEAIALYIGITKADLLHQCLNKAFTELDKIQPHLIKDALKKHKSIKQNVFEKGGRNEN